MSQLAEETAHTNETRNENDAKDDLTDFDVVGGTAVKEEEEEYWWRGYPLLSPVSLSCKNKKEQENVVSKFVFFDIKEITMFLKECDQVSDDNWHL